MWRRSGCEDEAVSRRPISSAFTCRCTRRRGWRRRSSRSARRVNPSARICAYGLYAPLNAEWLRSLGVDDVLGGEFEEELTAIAREFAAGPAEPRSARTRASGRTATCGPAFGLPRCRGSISSSPIAAGLPPLVATRRCRCRTAAARSSATPRRAAAAGICAATVRSCRSTTGSSASCSRTSCWPTSTAQVAAGAAAHHLRRSRFLQRPDARDAHRRGAARGASGASPTTSRSRSSTCCSIAICCRGCATPAALFVTSAVESVDDRVLALLDKGHTRRDFVEAVALCRASGLTLVPTFVAFHPWLTLDGLLRSARHDRGARSRRPRRADSARDPAARCREGSRLLELDEMRAIGRRLRSGDADVPLGASRSAASTSCSATSPRSSASRLTGDRRAVFDEISAARARARAAAAPVTRPAPARDRATVPYLNEPWYC